MQNLRFAMAAGETKVFVIAGRYLEIIDATGPVTIGLYDKNGSQTDDAKDVLSGTYMQGPFSQFEMYSATAQTVELFLTETGGGTRRQPGNVRVIDSSADKTRLGKQFWNGYTGPANGAAIKWVFAGAVGGEVAIKRLMIASATAGLVDIAIGGNTGTIYTAGSKFGLLNKYVLSASSTIAKIGEGVSAAAAPTGGELPGYASIGGLYVPANTLAELPLTTPMILKDGQLLLVGSRVINRDVQVILDVEEL